MTQMPWTSTSTRRSSVAVASKARPASPERLIVEVSDSSTRLAGSALFRGGADDLMHEFDGMVAAGERYLVVTPNVDQVLTMRTNPDALNAFTRASIRLVDGAPLLLLARMMGDHAVQRLTGADLLRTVAETAASRPWRVVVAGGSDDVSRRAAAQLRLDYPGADVVSVSFPVLTSVDDPRGRVVVDELNALKPQVVFLCLGFPKQEKWYVHWENHLPGAIYIGAGAAVDFAAGEKKRAPKVVQKAGFEWAWRVAQEPRRLARRYFLKGPGFIRVMGSSVAARIAGETNTRGGVPSVAISASLARAREPILVMPEVTIPQNAEQFTRNSSSAKISR